LKVWECDKDYILGNNNNRSKLYQRKLTTSWEKSPSQDVNNCSAIWELPCLLWSLSIARWIQSKSN
jgi:hypothetical protein